MGYIHPVIYVVVLFFGLYILWTGWLRFQTAFLKKKLKFLWKRHVQWGTYVLFLWGVAPFMGMAGSYLVFGDYYLMQPHANVGIVMFFLSLIGFATGKVMDKRKKPRKALPLIHGANNLILVILALWQAVTGFDLLGML